MPERGAGEATVHVVGLLGGRPVGAEAEAALRHVSLVAGGREQLAGVADLIAPGASTVVVGAGLRALDEVAASVEPACVLASGDPGFFGVLRPLAERVDPKRLVVHPAPSSVALAFGRLGLPWDGALVRSCHTGGAARVAAEVAHAPVAAVLCGPDAAPEVVGMALQALGASHRTVAVATRLGEPGEVVVRCADVTELAAGRFDHRSVVVLAWPEPSPVAAPARPGGRPVGDFAHRASMITKPEVRSVVLGKLDLPDRGVLWDVGAGSGSVAIEAALAAPGLRVVAVERQADDVARLQANAAAMGALVEVVQGSAPDVLVDLPPPDRVFVGGGGLDVLGAATAALRPGGRIVATFAAIDRAAEAHRLLGSLVQVGVDRAQVLPDGGIRFAADNPVFVAWGDRPAPATPAPGGRVAVGVGCSSMATADDVAALVTGALAAAGFPAKPVPSEEPGHQARGGGSSEEPGHHRRPPVPSEEPGHRSRGGGSSEEPGTPFLGDGVTQRSQDVGGGAVAPQRGQADGALTSGDVVSAGGAVAPQRGQADGDLTSGDVVVATIDRRRHHPAVTGAAGSRPILAFPASLLGTVDVPDPSDLVDAAVGTPTVAEAAALLAAGPGARLVVGKQRGATATAAVAVGPRRHRPGRVRIVGLGPGDPRHRTPAATTAVRQADAVIGYGAYVDAAGSLLRPDQMVLRSAMGAEAERAQCALALGAAGWDVAIVSSGDPGVFAMASVTLELAAEATHLVEVDIEVVPGVTASSAAAAAVGAPLAGPHATLTLSDLLLPWSAIEGQLRAAATSGMALALYNPRSAGRPDHLARAQAILLEILDPAVPVAVVTAAGDPGQRVDRATLATLDPATAGMRSLVLIGTAETVEHGGRLLTRRHHPRPEVTA